MSTILDKIVEYKTKEIAERKKLMSVKLLEAKPPFSRVCYSLKESILYPDKTGIIAEFKRKSPSKGIINNQSDVADVTTKYAAYGASGLSILTDNHFFGGNNEDVEKARSANAIPILRKEFIVDEYQIIEAKAIGADVILLIAECLSKEEVTQFAAFAKSLGLEVLLEMHSKTQLDKVSDDVTLVGINNRDLTTFEVNIDRSIELANLLPKKLPKIAESGISHPETIVRMKKAGFDGFLIGECFMKEEDPGEAFGKFVKDAEKVNI